MKKGFAYILLTAFFLQFFLNTGCANIIPPGGGPKDSIPPRLLKASPRDSSVNFSGNKIDLYFNEYIDVDNASQELIISPTTKSTPQVERKLNVLTVKFRDTLDANTTYSINFGNAIRDVNEGNKASQFTYVFSTGNTIDSMSLKGKVIIARSGKTDSTITVALYRNLDDSAVAKERPRYFARLNKNGEFTFRNLPSGKFRLFALKDDNGDKVYDSGVELFAFANEVINTAVKNDPVILHAFVADEKKETGIQLGQAKRGAAKPVAEKLKLSGNNLENYRADLLKDLELDFSTPIKKYDSTGIVLTNSKFEPLKDYHLSLDSSKKKIIVGWNKLDNTTYKVILKKDFASDTSGNSYAKNDTLSFTTKTESEYGSFKLRFNNLNKYRNPVLQLVTNDNIAASYSLKDPELNIRMFSPGSYELRLLEDENKNGVWDTGNYWKKKQPEIVTLLGTKLEVKAAWDKELIINL